jgi:hypothetical protein
LRISDADPGSIFRAAHAAAQGRGRSLRRHGEENKAGGSAPLTGLTTDFKEEFNDLPVQYAPN